MPYGPRLNKCLICDSIFRRDSTVNILSIKIDPNVIYITLLVDTNRQSKNTNFGLTSEPDTIWLFSQDPKTRTRQIR